MSSPPPDSSSSRSSTSWLTGLIRSLFSYNSNILLAALVSLLLVILFVLLLHLYAKWFLAQSRRRRRRRRPASSSSRRLVRPPRPYHSNTFTFHLDNTSNSTTGSTTLPSPSKGGLDRSLIASIPLFVYKPSSVTAADCVICLSPFEDDDIGRNLPKCGHAFHVECIDMWLQSHSTCPVCRAPAAVEKAAASVDDDNSNVANGDEQVILGRETFTGLSEPESGDLGLTNIVGVDHPLQQPQEAIVLENVDTQIDLVVNSDDHEDSLSASASSLSSSSDLGWGSSSLGCSLKRMLSKSRSERKVYPSVSDVVSELEVFN
ncbi:RING-H2 finger protein ATL63 [Malania oleifera]|uniref:RING-H2 finger protein ATL63 n=1 Tax=Malania oleifera TaxID=397392 RepID=UPI0025ADE082|nr:RING-H2 finger protein ATL63 [Malania oleifera]